MSDVVKTRAEAERLQRSPHVILEPLEAFLDAAGLGTGPIVATPIEAGHSNVTYLLTRGARRMVLRRPPRGPLPPSAHDILREARLQMALANAGVRVPEVLTTCDDDSILGAPFYVMAHIDGEVLTTELPAAFAHPEGPREIAEELVEALVELHAADIDSAGLSAFGRGAGYLERQVRRFRSLLEQNATRPLPELHAVADWLDANRPTSGPVTPVHGDYRLGNVMFSPESHPRLIAVLDWEMATLGDPLADLGYLTAMWAEPDDTDDPVLALGAVTRSPGFPSRAELIERYAKRSGRDPSGLTWYQILAVWKAAIFLENSYKRFLAGTTNDRYFERLRAGVPILASRAGRLIDTGR